MANNYLRFSTTLDLTEHLKRGARPRVLQTLRGIAAVRTFQSTAEELSTSEYQKGLTKTIGRFVVEEGLQNDGSNKDVVAWVKRLTKVLNDVFLGPPQTFCEDLHWEINSASKELSVTIWAEEHGDVTAAAEVIMVLLGVMGSTEGHTFQWAKYCDRSRPDEFGGGVAYVDASTARYLGTHDMEDIVRNLAGDRKFGTPFSGDPEVVPSDLARALVRGLRDAGVLAKAESLPASGAARMEAIDIQRAKVALLPVLSLLKKKEKT